MTDTAIVLRKELRELVMDAHARRGVQIQAWLIVGVLGVVLPLSAAGAWIDVRIGFAYYLTLPPLIAAGLGADGFAGERERKTLETLLATPLGERGILFGKIGAAVLLSTVVASSALWTSVLATHLLHRADPAPVPTVGQGVAIVVGSFGTGLLVAALAGMISLRTASARAAQQMSSVVALGIGGLGRVLISTLPNASIAAIASVFIAAGLLACLLTAKLFQRSRLIEKR